MSATLQVCLPIVQVQYQTKHEVRAEAYSAKRAGLAGGGGAVVQSLAGQSEGLHSRVSSAPGTVDACRANPLEGPLCQGAAALPWPCRVA